MIFEKGATATGGAFKPLSANNNKPATYIFNGPVQVLADYRGFNAGSGESHLVFNSKGNKAKFLVEVTQYVGTLMVDDAFEDTGFLFNGDKGLLELGKTHQKMTWLCSGVVNSPDWKWFADNAALRKRGTINGEYPSALEITMGAPNEAATSVTNSGVQITGSVKLEKSGAGWLRMLNLAYESSGDVEVRDGTLMFDAGATWLNGSNVTVRGNGMLKLGSGGTFNKDIALVADGENWKLDLTGIQKVDTFTVDGVKMPGGTYGVAHKTLGSHFAGTGSLVVKSVGFTVIVR